MKNTLAVFENYKIRRGSEVVTKGVEPVTNCHRLKLEAADGKKSHALFKNENDRI